MKKPKILSFLSFLSLISLFGIHSFNNEPSPIEVPEQEYSIQDGDFEVLFENQQEYGINITIMGEGYTREDIESGLYKQALSSDIEKLFTVYPLSDYQKHFNVYLVYAISKDEGISIFGEEDKNTALSVSFSPDANPPMSSFQWSPWKVRQYAKSGTLISKFNHLSFVSMKNSDGLPLGGVASISRALQGQALYPTGRIGIMAHEFGHAFASLADEYRVEDQDQFTPEIIQAYRRNTWLFPNVDTLQEYEQVKWNKYRFIQGYEEVGNFEGAYYVDTLIWRPEENSIMVSSSANHFNAPSREAIIFRIAQLARFYFDFDAFIERDRQEKNRMNRALSMGVDFSCGGFHPESKISQEFH